jgi:tetratricopeptide (TPR) repeat protein
MNSGTERRPGERDSAGKLTLPPPDWTAPRVGGRVEVEAPTPLRRRVGRAVAAEGALRAEVLAATAAKDAQRERAGTSRLARWLASQDRSWEEALRLAQRSLEIGDDESLRHELSGWLEGLGEAAASAEVLEPLATSGTRDPIEAVRLLLHMGVLEARAGNAKGAAATFARAARLDPSEALASELLGTLGSWAPNAVLPSEAAESYVEAAGRRQAAQALDAQMEDLLRAFDVDPTSSVAVAALAAALTERGRPLGADEVWRAHAAALRPSDEKRSRAVHARRRLQARAAGDLARALGAALDEGLDATFGTEIGDFMDDLLLRAGLLEPLVARLEIRAEGAPRATKASLFEEIARLHAGPLANADRAATARVIAFEADPTREDVLAALRVHATETRDATELVEALIRAVLAPEDAVPSPVRLATARSLAVIADEALKDPVLAAWAASYTGESGARDGARTDALVRARAELGRLQRSLVRATPEDRIEILRTLATELRSCPDEGELNAQVLGELAARLPTERRWHVEAVRLAFRRRDFVEVIRLATTVRERPHTSLQDVVDAVIIEAAARRALGEITLASETTQHLVVKATDDPRALAIAWMNASLAGDRETRSVALEELAKFAGASVRAVLYAVAAEARAAIGDRESPRRLAERACHTDPSSARAVGTLADATVGAHDRTAASALERGIHFLFARSVWCRGLAEALDAMGEGAYAVGWTQRLVALRPGDRKAMSLLLERVARTGDGTRLGEALMWVLSQPQPASVLSDLVAAPLRDLVAIDPARAAEVARRALDAFGARLTLLRDAILSAADSSNDSRLALATLERAVALEEPRQRIATLHLLRLRQERAGDVEGRTQTLLLLARASPDRIVRDAVMALPETGLSEDGELARLEAIALLARSEEGPEAAAVEAAAWRELGAARWDLAGDHEGAVDALWRAARLFGEPGLVAFAFDLAQLGGASFALDHLEQRIDDEVSDVRAATMAADTARVALALGEPSRGLDFAVTALARNPKMAEALEIAEAAATRSGREVELTRVYDDLTVRALGRFARRAVNYRAARFFEQQSDDGLALKHAARAFQAVPSEGAALLLLIRTAERAGDRAQAVGAMVQVAENTRDHGARFGWLLRAASATGSDEQGLGLRVDVLLHALTVSRDPRASSALMQAARDLLRTAPDERASLELRLARASKTVTAKADGPEGARLGVCFALVALDLFGDARWGSEALMSALGADADLDDYTALLPFAEALAAAGDTEPLFALAGKQYTNFGVAAYRLLARIAEVRGDRARAADLYCKAAVKDPDDADLVRMADTALREHGDDAQWARLKRASPDTERARIFRAYGTARLREGAIDDARAALERAKELAPIEDRPTIERELGAAYDASGHADRVEERAVAEADDATVPDAVRAERWADVARLREARGDMSQAVDAWLAATDLGADSVERWAALERAATEAGREDARIMALRQLAERVPPAQRITTWKRLARALETHDAFQEAEAVWRRVADADPDDEEADHAVEALISALRNYVALASHLERRTARLAKVPGAREALRAVRLRRAAILEQRLGRTRDALAELTLVLDEAPDNVSALSYLADLHERLGEYSNAAPIWLRVALLSRDPSTQSELELRAGQAAFEGRDFRSALASAKNVLAREPGRKNAIELRVAAARALEEYEELGSALEDLAGTAGLEAWLRAEALVEASDAAGRLGREHLALDRARRAAEVAPERAATQIVARSLEYRLRGAGTPDEALTTLAQLDAIAEELSAEDAAVVAFLRAEALDVVPTEGSSLIVLRDAAGHSTHPLLSLGLAERLLATGDAGNALVEFEVALTGDLAGFRDRGRVALAAADAALRAGREPQALAFLEDAALSPTVRTTAMLKAAEIARSHGDLAETRRILSDLAARVAGDDRARALGQHARLERESGDPDARIHAAHFFEQAMACASPGSPLAAQLASERAALDAPESPQGWSIRSLEAPSYALAGPESMRRPAGEAEPALGFAPTQAFEAARPLSAPPGPARPLSGHPPSSRPVPAPPVLSPVPPVLPGEAVSIEDFARAISAASTPEQRAAFRLAHARACLDAGQHEAGYASLEAALEEGGREAGEILASLYQTQGRLTDVVRIRRVLVALQPGDFGSLDALRMAASLDRNQPYARALDHVARVFDPTADPVIPPPLSAQAALPGFLAYLTRTNGDRVAEALSLVWEDGHSAWGKDPIGVLQGAQPAATTNAEVARIYEAAIGLLGLPRVPLFLRPSDDAPSATVTMTWPPAAILSGRVREESAELRHALGQALALTLSPNIISLGLSPTDARNAFRAIMGAFGPPESSRAMNKESGRLAEALWHVLPPRTQRRLQALLGPVSLSDFELAPGRAWQSAHRLGLFLAGDFKTAVSSVLASRARADGNEPPSLHATDWMALCHENAAVADLFQLAVSPEYAEARWRPAARRSTPPSAPMSRRSVA